MALGYAVTTLTSWTYLKAGSSEVSLLRKPILSLICCVTFIQENVIGDHLKAQIRAM
jgi:hypothetical protein